MTGRGFFLRGDKRRKIDIGYEYGVFHESVIYLVLLRLPASVLYNVMRYICKSWYNIITNPHFKEEHLCHSSDSTQGLLVDFQLSPRGCLFLSPADMKPYVDLAINRRLRIDKLFPRDVLDTCDGLLITHLHNSFDRNLFEIVNPVTKQCRSYFIPDEAYIVKDFKLLRSRINRLSRHYNIVCAYEPKPVSSEEGVPPVRCGIAVLTLGSEEDIYGEIDQWQTLSLDENYRQGYLLLHCCLSTTEGYVYVKVSDVQGSSSGLLSMDVDRKVVREIPPPPCSISGDSRRSCPLMQGRALTAIDICTTDTTLKLSGWIWNEALSKWTVLFTLRPSIPSTDFSSCPWFGAWIRDEQLLVFGSRFIASYYLCNVKTGQVSCILRYRRHNIKRCFISRVYSHTQSLVFVP